jgi:hypothetical protein
LNHGLILNPEEALELTAVAITMAHNAHSSAVEAVALNATGQIQYDIGKNDEALLTLQSALQVSQALPERSEEAAVRATLAAVYGFTGHPD